MLISCVKLDHMLYSINYNSYCSTCTIIYYIPHSHDIYLHYYHMHTFIKVL